MRLQLLSGPVRRSSLSRLLAGRVGCEVAFGLGRVCLGQGGIDTLGAGQIVLLLPVYALGLST